MRFNFNLPPPYPPGYEPVDHFANIPISGSWDGKELVIDTGDLNIHAGKYDPQEVARNAP